MEDASKGPSTCCRPPALDDLTLIAAIDGETDIHVREHLGVCVYCTRRAREFAHLQGLLRRRLYRILCPSSEELIAFHQGWMERERRRSLRDHLNSCPHCTGELRRLVEASDRPMIEPPSPISRLRRIVAELLAPPMHSTLAGAYGGLRGPSRGSQYAYRAENLQIMIDVERAASRPDHLVLLGLLLLDDNKDTLNSTSASLLCNDMVVNSAMLDDLGTFVLEGITPGDYSLSLRLPDREVIVEALSL